MEHLEDPPREESLQVVWLQEELQGMEVPPEPPSKVGGGDSSAPWGPGTTRGAPRPTPQQVAHTAPHPVPKIPLLGSHIPL